MKAEITANGKLILIPETGTEAYALQRWSDAAVVQQVDEQRAETFHYRGSSLTVDMSSLPEVAPVMSKEDREAWTRAWKVARPGQGWLP